MEAVGKTEKVSVCAVCLVGLPQLLVSVGRQLYVRPAGHIFEFYFCVCLHMCALRHTQSMPVGGS